MQVQIGREMLNEQMQQSKTQAEDAHLLSVGKRLQAGLADLISSQAQMT